MLHSAIASGLLPRFRIQFQFINENLLQLVLWPKVFNLGEAYYLHPTRRLLGRGEDNIKKVAGELQISNAKLCAIFTSFAALSSDSQFAP